MALGLPLHLLCRTLSAKLAEACADACERKKNQLMMLLTLSLRAAQATLCAAPYDRFRVRIDLFCDLEK